MIDLGFVLLLSVWSACVGLAIARRLVVLPERPTDALALAVPLGLGTLSLVTLGLGTIGQLSPLSLAVVLAIGLAASLWDRVKSGRFWPATTTVESIVASESPGGRLVGLAFDLALAGGLIGSLLTALAPVTDGDALCYHLQVPKVFLWSHATGFEPDLHETVYPLVTEMLYAVALAFRGPVACRLIQWVFGLVFAASVTALARPALGRRARWAGTVALLAPAVSNGMGAPLNDVALAACCNAALLAWTRWRERPTVGSAVLVGTLAGIAIGVKYPALVWSGLLGLAMIGAGRRRFSQVAAFGVSALVVGGGWYLRAFAHTGNPVFPFFRGLFGSGIDEVLDPIKRPLAVTPWNLLTALGPMTLWPDRFDSLAHQFGPVFLLFLPALFVLRPPRRVWGLAAFGFLFLTLCLTQRQSMRFVLAALGPFAVGVGWLATEGMRRGLAGRAIFGLLLAILAAESGLALARSRHGLSVVVGREAPDDFLARREPTWRVGRWIGAHLAESARIVGQDHRGYYVPRPYVMELAHRRRTGLGTRGESAEAIVAHLQAQGFTHLMMCPPIPEDAVEFDPTLGRRLAPWLATRRPVYSEEIADADGVVRRYEIFELGAIDLRELARATR